MNYEVRTEKFTGPLDKLLQLIEEKHLEITQISLAEVTADFLRYVKSLGEKVEPAILADFLVVAAKMVLIKSKVLLPMLELTKEEEEEIHDLEGRLKLYREFKIASEHIKKLWDKNKISYARPLFLSLGDQVVFYPPSGLKASDLTKAINNLAAALQAILPEAQTIKKAVVTIEQKIEELLNRFKEAGRQSFKTMAQQKSRSEAIVLFLAILHLLKDRVIQVEQEEHFKDIVVERSQT
jgi:segregation and condensation protein A